MSDSTPPPSPHRIFETINAYQRSAALKAAIDLDLFTAIGEGSDTPALLSSRCNAAERGVRILSDYLAVIGLLEKTGDRYRLAPDAAVFLDRRSPAYIGGMTEFLLSLHITDAFKVLSAAVRKGGTTISEEGTLEPNHPVWVQFARAMMPMMARPAEQIVDLVPVDSKKELKVLDIAAGHGLFGIAFARRYPNARVTALDWPAVLEAAQENAKAAGVEDRYALLPGSAFEVPFGEGYDLILLTNFLHHFDPPTNESLLKKVRAALAEGGRAVTLEFVPNEDRVSPPIPAAFSLSMLAGTASGDAYTFPEMETMLKNAGFTRSEIHPLDAAPQQVIVSTP